MMLDPDDWTVRLAFVRDVLEGVLLAAERGRAYPEPELVRRAVAYLVQHEAELRAAA